MTGRRRFFSGTSESQAAIEAAAALGVPVSELAYRPVDKRGALRPGRVVIEVDPDNPRRAAEAVAPPAAPVAAPPPPRMAPPERREPPRDTGWSRREGGDERRRDRPRFDDGPEEVLATAGPEPAPSLSGAAGAREAAAAVVALSGLELEPAVAEGEPLQVELGGHDRPALVARQGELLRSFEYLLRRMVRDLPEGGLTADSGGFRAEREEALRGRAVAAAEEVRRSGEAVTFEPLGAAERRIVHLAIQEEAGVASASEGAGDTKRVRVFPVPGTP